MVMTTNVIFQKTLGIILTVFVDHLHQNTNVFWVYPNSDLCRFCTFLCVLIELFGLNTRWTYTIAAQNIFLVRLLA
jgi:hypothetical protein